MGRGGGSGRREIAVDESRKETADRVAKYQTDYVVGRTCLSMLLLAQTAAAAFKVLLLCFGFPALSFRSWSYSVYVVVLFCFVCHISSGGGTTPLFYFITSYQGIVFCCYRTLAKTPNVGR